MIHHFLEKNYIDSNLGLTVGRFFERTGLYWHSHEFWEISYVYEGTGIHHFEDGSVQAVHSGDFIFVSPGAVHCIESPQKKGKLVRVINVLISSDIMLSLTSRLLQIDEINEYELTHKISKKEPFCILMTDNTGDMDNMLQTALNENVHACAGCEQIIKNIAFCVLIYICRLYESNKRKTTLSTTKDDLMDNLIRYIRSSIAHDITLNSLASYVHLSPEYLSRCFKKKTGVNVSVFISETRLEKAKHLLRTTGLSITDIYMTCGYKNGNTFQKAFKNSTGISASDYRKKHENKIR